MTGSLFCLATLSFALLGQPADPVRDPTTEPLDAPLNTRVRAVLRSERTVFPAGGNIMLEFVIQNTTNETVELKVPGALSGKLPADYGMGLPLEHVFSGPDFRGLDVRAEINPDLGRSVTRKPEYPVPPVRLAPYATIGLRFDISRFYPALRQTGKYELKWRPYGGTIESNSLNIDVVSYKEAHIETEFGKMRMELFYDKAPKHVENFIELAQNRFYNNRSIFYLVPGNFLLSGCPNDDGTGMRKDGKTLEPEFNDMPIRNGTVTMALIDGDPTTGSSQFIIWLTPQRDLNDAYTPFGQIVGPESEAVLRQIADVPVDEYNRPKQPIRIRTITIVNATTPQRF